MEIERYTLATGETAITGFARFWKPWWVLFIFFVMGQNFWPGRATGASTRLSYIFGFSGSAIIYLTVAALVTIGIALTTSPVVYQMVEKVQAAMVVAIMAFVFVAVFVGTTGEAWGALITEGVGSPGLLIGQEGLGIALLLGALAFAGAAGRTTSRRATTSGTKAWACGYPGSYPRSPAKKKPPRVSDTCSRKT